jgi:hypothetical protein
VRVTDRLGGVIEVRAIRAAPSCARAAAREKARHADADFGAAEFGKADRIAGAAGLIGQAGLISADFGDRLQQIAIKIHGAPGQILVNVNHRSHFNDYAMRCRQIKDF